MSVSTIFALLFYFAATFLLVGLAFRIIVYFKTPAPLKIPTMPAPMTRRGVVVRLFREIAFFESLFKANKWIWIFGWLFHMGMLVVLLRHLRYFQEPVWFWVSIIQPFGVYAGFAMLVGLIGLSVRRIVVERIRYITSPSDHLMLVLLMSMAISGMVMKYISHTDIVAVKTYMLGLMYFDWQPLPNDPALLVHLSLIVTLMIIFPISKLLHAPGLLFSPSRNQVDNSRDKRHVTPWAAE